MERLSKLFLILAAAGIPDSLYHAYDEITNYSAPGTACHLNRFVTCVGVFQSGYTKFLGVSLWVYGVVWFPVLLSVAWWLARNRGGIDGILLLPILTVGNVFTLYLWHLELQVIHEICPICVSLYSLNYAMTLVAATEALRKGSGPHVIRY